MAANRKPTKAELRQARAAAVRQEQARLRRRARAVRVAGLVGGVVLLVAVVAVVVVLSTRSGAPPAAAGSSTPIAAVGRTTNPPWDAPADPSAAVASAGLTMLGEEGSAQHIHAHLDVIVNGAPVQVPSDIGVDDARSAISPLHSHDTSGVIHVESPSKTDTFTLGQFFAEWQVSLAADHIGGLRVDGSDQLKVYVNGHLRAGDPGGIVLGAHDEIAVVYGTDAQQVTVPSSYQWTAGL